MISIFCTIDFVNSFYLQYLERNGITDLTRENFTFSSKYNIGDFMEARHGENVSFACYVLKCLQFD